MGGVHPASHKMATPSLLNRSGSGAQAQSFMRPKWRLIRSVFDMARVEELAVGIFGRQAVSLCDLPAVADMRSPVLLLHEF